MLLAAVDYLDTNVEATAKDLPSVNCWLQVEEVSDGCWLSLCTLNTWVGVSLP